MLNEGKKVVPKFRQEVKVKADIVTSDTKIYYTRKFQNFTSWYIINDRNVLHRIFNQSVENSDVAFVKGADERNKFFEKINNQ